MEQMETDGVSGGSSPGEGVSAWAGSGGGPLEEDRPFYIPERRASLDLGEVGPGRSGLWFEEDHFWPKALSYTSMASDELMEPFLSVSMFDEPSTRVILGKTGSYSSCYSFDSDDCEKKTRKVRNKEEQASELQERAKLFKDLTEPVHPALTVGFTFKAISRTLEKLSEEDLRCFKATLWKQYPQSFATPPQSLDMVDLVDRLLECYDLQGSLQLTKVLLEEMGLSRLVCFLQDLCILHEVRFELRRSLKERYGSVHEGGATSGERTGCGGVFTDLHITSIGDNGPNIQHEVRQIEKLNSHGKPETLISCEDILGVQMVAKEMVRCVLTTGMAGSGKSMAVQRFILDWAEERSHQHISLLFPLPFRELNGLQGSELSLLDLLYRFYPETRRLKDLFMNEEKIVLVLDGLDEFTQELDFYQTELWSDITEPTALNVLLVNLLRGMLSHRALLWVTSRPRRSLSLPAEAVHQVIEVRGFSDAQKEEYFKNRFEDTVQAQRVVAHLHSCKTLYIMCHLPLFCSVLSGVFQCAFREHGPQAELPKSITPVYTQLLLALLATRSSRAPAWSSVQERDFLMNLGKMAFTMLNQGQLKISRSDWTECRLDVHEAVVNSGLCTEFIVEEFLMYREKVHCFIHSTVQEYMAALYVFLSFTNHEKNVFGKGRWTVPNASLERKLYRTAVERSLLYEDGRLDIFLRFLLGMALKSNLELLKPFISSSGNRPSVAEDAALLIRRKMGESKHRDRKGNLQGCLDELCGNHSP